MKKEGFFSKLNVKITLSFLLISLLVVVSVSLSIYYLASKMIGESEESHTRDSVLQASNYIASYLDKVKSLSDLLAMHPEIKDAISKSNPKSLEALYGMVDVAAKDDPRIQTIAVISKEGFAITNNSDMTVSLSENMMEEEWYRNALKSEQMPVVTSIGHGSFSEDSNRIISISHEIRDEKGLHLGVVLIDISYRFIEDYISSLNLGKDGYAFILDSEDRLIYHPDESFFSNREKIRELTRLAELSEQKKGECISVKVNIPHSDWTLVGISSTENLNLLKDRLFDTMFFVGGGLIFISFLISFLLSKRLSKPIVELRNAMMSLDENWKRLKIDDGGLVEIVSLVKEYNSLIDRVRTLTENIAKEENEKRIFELKALQNQINPHFLYNTLDTILWLAEFNETEKVVEVTKSLAEMLRFSLNINQVTAKLKLELSHIENYLKIQKQRYEDRLDYRIDGEEELLEIEIPKLILQPLVENAIYHGIRPLSRPGMIEIEYRRRGEFLIIEVRDDGVGYRGSKQGEENTSVGGKAGGIGLKNVDQRIKLLCGEKYGIEIREGEEIGTRVTLRLGIHWAKCSEQIKKQ